MDILAEWLPRTGALLTIVLGLVGFFRPHLITDAQQITLGSPMANRPKLHFGFPHPHSHYQGAGMHAPGVAYQESAPYPSAA